MFNFLKKIFGAKSSEKQTAELNTQIAALKQELSETQLQINGLIANIQDVNSVVATSALNVQQIKEDCKEELQNQAEEIRQKIQFQLLENNTNLLKEISKTIQPPTELEEKIAEAELMKATAALQREETLERIEDARYRQIESQLKTYEIVRKSLEEGKINQVNL